MSKSAKALGYFISDLPHFPPNTELTDDQANELLKFRKTWYWIGRCFKAHFSGQNNPFDAGEVSLDPPQFEDMILMRTDSYIKLWGLIQVAFKVIKTETLKTNNEFPFGEAQELFRAVVAHDANSSIEAIFQPYQEVSAERFRKSIDHFQKGIVNPPSHSKAASDMRDGLTEIKKNRERGWSCWDEYIVLWLVDRALKQPKCPHKGAIKQAFEACVNVNLSIMEHTKTALRRRGKWGQVYSGSYAWKDGEKLPSQKGGVYRKSLNET